MILQVENCEILRFFLTPSLQNLDFYSLAGSNAVFLGIMAAFSGYFPNFSACKLQKKSIFAGQISAIFNKNLGFWPVKNKIFVFCRPPQLLQADIRPVKSSFFYFLQAKPEEQCVIYNLWIASPSACNVNFFLLAIMLPGRCGVGAGNKIEVHRLNAVPAPEVLQSKTSRPLRFMITPLGG